MAIYLNIEGFNQGSPLMFNLKYLGTADNERVFSALNLDTTTRRLLSPTSLDDIRIRQNGPKLEHFNALKYVKYWIFVQNKKPVDDDPKEASQETDPNTYYEDSTIF